MTISAVSNCVSQLGHHRGIPYYFWCEVEADSPEEALEKAHDTEGKMGESEDSLAILTHVCPECGGPPDDRVLAGMKCGPCAYK